jgi:CRP-like cAMP-binding protein
MPARAEDLANVALFASLREEELQRLAAWLDVESVSAGVRLAGEGAPGYSFFVLDEGSAVVTADGKELATLEQGDFFGEIAILGDGRRSATVTTTAPTRALVLFGTEFRRLQQEHPPVAARLEAAMRDRLAERG